jgi:hypothetical protein
MLVIYVVYHNELEDCNVFFTDEALAKETETDIKEWNIRVFEEGVKFWADLASY